MPEVTVLTFWAGQSWAFQAQIYSKIKDRDQKITSKKFQMANDLFLSLF
jgi:hypothetical protein